MASFVDACIFIAASNGTGSFVVSSPKPGWRSPASAGAVNGDSYRYRAFSADQTEWEIGTGVYTSGTTTLTRAVITASSNAGAAVNFTLAPSVALTIFSGDLATVAQLAKVDFLTVTGSTNLDTIRTTVAALGTASTKNTGTSAGQVPLLDGSGLLDTSILPAIAITDVNVVASQADMLALTAQKGDIAIRSDLNKTFGLSTNSPSTLADWKELLAPTDAVLSVAALTGAISAAALKAALSIAVADITDASANGRSLISAADFAAMKLLLAIAQADVAGLTTASSPQFSAVEIGHSTDTTLSRSSAGRAAIEGRVLALGDDVSASSGFRNRLINGDGRINQRGPTSAADDVYAWDRHYALTQTAAIAPSVLSDVADGLPSMMRLSQSQATAQRMGVAQIIESVHCKDLRSKDVSLIGKLRCSAAQPIRYAILEWTGTTDAVTSDVVNSWTNGTFTAGQFFISSNLTVRQVGAITPSANTITDFALTATLGSTFNNLIVMAWTEGTAAQNVTFDLAWQFARGSLADQTYPISARSFSEELSLCQRYYRKSFPLATPPANNAGAAGTYRGSQFVGSTALMRLPHIVLSPPMRATPTAILYNPSANNSQIRNDTLNADWSSSSVDISESAMTIFGTTNGSSSVPNLLSVHFTLEAEL